MATRFTSLAALACTREVGSWQLAPAEAADGVRINVSASRTEDGVRECDRVWPSLIGQIIRPSAQKFRLESRYLYHIWRLRIHPQGEQSDAMAGFLQATCKSTPMLVRGPSRLTGTGEILASGRAANWPVPPKISSVGQADSRGCPSHL